MYNVVEDDNLSEFSELSYDSDSLLEDVAQPVVSAEFLRLADKGFSRRILALIKLRREDATD